MKSTSMRNLLAATTLVLLLVIYVSISTATASSSSSSSNSSQSSASTTSSSSKATQARQSPISAASAIVGALGSLVPSLITNVAPLVLLVGLGALMMPQLGFNAMGLLRESRRSAQDPHQQLPLGGAAPGALFPGAAGQFALPRPLQTTPQDIYYFTKRSLGSSSPSSASSSWMPNSEQVMHGLQEVLERVAKALDNAEKRYN